MVDGYVEFDEVQVHRPVKGVYRVRVSVPSGLEVTRLFRVAEGLPHRVAFDTTEWEGGREGRPLSTLTIRRELAVQPRFRMLDEAGNTVEALPAAHDVFVRVKAVQPWPRCVADPCGVRVSGGAECHDHNASSAGMWGVAPPPYAESICRWYTPPLEDTTPEADEARQRYDPRFSKDGIASYAETEEAMFLWGREGETYDVTFAFYGEVLTRYGYILPDLTATGISTSRCAEKCQGTVCEFDPPSVVLTESTQQSVVVYGDYYDAIRSSSSDVRVQLTYGEMVCELQDRLVQLRDPCSIRVTLPSDETSCVNMQGRGGSRGVHSQQMSVLRRPGTPGVKVSTGGADFTVLPSKSLAVKGTAVQLGVHNDLLALPQSSRQLTSSERVTVFPITITVKDVAGNDVGKDDPGIHTIEFTIEREVSGRWEKVVWNGTQHGRDYCKVATRTCLLMLSPDHPQAVMRNGSVTFNVVLQAPTASIYGVLAHERSGTLHPTAGTHFLWFQVVAGRPYRMRFATEPATLIDNKAEDATEYLLLVEDFAGNIISSDTAGVKISAAFTVEVPEFQHNNTLATLLKRRGETLTDESRKRLMKQACAIRMAAKDVEGLTSPPVSLSSSIRFILTTFKIWNGFTCKLAFHAVGDGPSSSVLAEELNRQTTPPLVVGVRARQCESGQFAYSLEFGCWNHKLRKVIDGPRNRPSGTALSRTDEENPYRCLTQCGECEEGMLCDGSVMLAAKANYWREPVGYQAFECNVDNCVGVETVPADYTVRGGLGPMGATSASDRERAWTQCKEGTIGPLCGVCDRRKTDEAPRGYGRSGESCSKCPPNGVNYVLLATAAVSLVIVVTVMVVVNLQVGAVVKENPIVSVMIRMFLNHLQVTSLAGDLHVEWGSLISKVFNSQSKASVDANTVSVDCVSQGDYYDVFIAWALLPGAVVVIPGIVVLLLKLFRDEEGSRPERDLPPAIECMSPYHWLYDWQVDERDKSAMLHNIDVAARCDDGSTVVELRSRKGWVPTGLKREANPVAVKICREDIDPTTLEPTLVWSANLILGEFGCGLCRRCCMLEQLFPTEGVGRVKESVYNCTLDAHQVTVRRLRLFFKGSLLDACEARQALKMAIAKETAEAPHKTLSVEAQRKILMSLFLPKKSRALLESMGHTMDSLAEQSLPGEMKRGLELQRLAMGRTPPWPVKAHQSVFTTLPKRVPLTMKGADGGEVNLLHKYLAATELMTTKSDERGAASMGDTMWAEKMKTTESDSLWKVKRSDPVTKTEREWYTHTDPLTPPSTPPSKGYLALPIENETEEVIPDWMLETEFKELGKARDVAAAISRKRDLIPVATGATSSEMLISMHDVAQHVSYSDLYAMARLRRTRDKFKEWRAKGYSMEQIKSAMVEHDEFKEPELVVAAIDTMGVKRKSYEWESISDNIQALPSDEGESRLVRDMTYQRVKLEDQQLEVLYDCALCQQDFAVWYCPHDDEYYCEQCDHILHQHGEKASHLRLKPQPRTSPLYEAGYETQLPMGKVYIVAVLVIIFLVYPSLMKMIALMMSCTEEMCVDLETCHRYLAVDPQVDCSVSPYPRYRALAFLFFLAYGCGIPLLGFIALKRKRDKLKTKEVLGTLGFLYTGFREKRYYWEMVIMVRKMIVVFIVVFLSRDERYQIYAAMWTVTFFVFVNIFLRPFKYKVLWKMENLSLISIMVTLNLGLLFFEDLPPVARTAISLVITVVNVGVVAVFLVLIAREARTVVYELIDENGDGDLTCQELSDFIETEYEERKPKCCRSRRQFLDAHEDHRQRMLAMRNGVLTGAYYEWRHGPAGPEPRENRAEWVSQMLRTEEVEQQPRCIASQMSIDDMRRWWKVIYGSSSRI